MVMMFVSLKIFTKRTSANSRIIKNCTHSSSIRSWLFTLLAGGLSGLLGIGGGFLVVPLLVYEFHFSVVKAIATSLLIISFMGSITALSYSPSHPIDISYVMWLIIGGAVGGWGGASVVNRLKKRQRVLNIIFASMLLGAAIYFLLRAIHVI
ncbi:TSUP family transporter [Klebsiella huaxiensis]